ncbi:MAG: response regulator [Lachnospiraceae bacterium]|nr:response regulator [Lachnospiraceae bacterium]MBD5502267.1 response regulator [Lachnospiraceae bacterium]
MKTVLIVEDEKMIRQGIRTMIQRSGVPVEVIIECNSGDKALEILKNQKVDVMFTDIRMPKMNGIELVQKVQELPEQPIMIAVSGYADFNYAVEMMSMGVREYILKPVERDKIQTIMKKLEQEITQNQESRRTSNRIGHQQLKYLMLNEQVTEEELSTMQEKYESEFELYDYYVCVSNPKEWHAFEESYIYLHNVENNDVYLVTDKNMQMLLKNEFAQQYVGVSAIHSGIRELGIAYREAVEARHHAFCTDRRNFYVEEIGTGLATDFYEQGKELISAEKKQQRVQLIGTDKTDELVRAWERFFHVVKNGWITPADFAECMDDFFAEIRKTYRNMLDDEEEKLTELADYYGAPVLTIWQEAFMEWILALHERINDRFDTSKNQQKIKQAIEYIQENYDKDLNMAVVSNRVSMNYSLFSYLFKEVTGNNFVNYLKGIRVEEAKKLLAETDMRIVEISVKVGYENEKHFMRIFKATCGVSPSEYRRNAQMH